MIKHTVAHDQAAILNIIRESGQFDDESLAYVENTLVQHLNSNSGEIWLTAHAEEPVGVAYCRAEPVTSGTWNLLMLWTAKSQQRNGHGSDLIQHLENLLKAQNERLLIVETSGMPEFEAARRFYSKCGFKLEATVKDFFTDGDDKLIYTKSLLN